MVKPEAGDLKEDLMFGRITVFLYGVGC